MSEMSTAGWYPDPEGRAGLERWWNGLGWSESIRPVGSAGTTLTAPAGMLTQNETPDGPWNPVPAPQGGGEAGGRTPGRGRPQISAAAWGWLSGAVALAVIIGVVVVVGNSTTEARPPLATGAVPEAPTRPPGQTRIIDQAAGVAYPYLGAYWLEFVNEVAETTSTAGQYIVTQEVVPTGGQFIAQVTSGPLQSSFGYAGPASFAATIAAVAASVRMNYYPAPNEIETLRDEEVTIDGAAAYLLVFNLTWDVPGYDSTGERAALILIETGRAAPALMYISIPNTHAELYGIVDRVIAEIDVLN